MRQIALYIAVAGGMVMGSCNTRANKELEAKLHQQQQAIETMKIAMDRQHVIDSMSMVANLQQAEAVNAKPVAAVRTYKAPRRSSANRVSSYAATRPAETSTYQQPQAVYQPQAVSQPTVAYQEPVQQQKKRWSSKATGAAIGAGVGAVSGAMIGKRKGTGALIGAGAGALAGLGVGAIIDHKKGR